MPQSSGAGPVLFWGRPNVPEAAPWERQERGGPAVGYRSVDPLMNPPRSKQLSSIGLNQTVPVLSDAGIIHQGLPVGKRPADPVISSFWVTCASVPIFIHGCREEARGVAGGRRRLGPAAQGTAHQVCPWTMRFLKSATVSVLKPAMS